MHRVVEAIRQGDVPGVQLRVRRALPLDRVAVWPWLVEPELLGRWAAERASSADGGRTIDLATALADGGERHERLGLRETVAPARVVAVFERLADRWDAPTELTFELTALAPGACELSLLHAGFQNLALSRCLTIWEDYRRSWRAAVERLAAAAVSAPPAS